MTYNQWQLDDAKNHFNEVVRKALDEGPQIVSRSEIEEVVVLSIDEYRKLTKLRHSLSQFFRQSPLVGIQLDLERDRSHPRDVQD